MNCSPPAENTPDAFLLRTPAEILLDNFHSDIDTMFSFAYTVIGWDLIFSRK